MNDAVLTACPKCFDPSPVPPGEVRHVGVLTLFEDGRVACDRCGSQYEKGGDTK